MCTTVTIHGEVNIFNVEKIKLNILPYIILSMINAEYSVASDIAKKLKGDFSCR